MSQLLVLHAIRIVGFAEAPVLAGRFGLEESVTAELLADARAHGWVAYASFADLGGWSLTEWGRAEGERLLREELEQWGARDVLEATYQDFLPLNGRLQRACTNWQLRPAPGDRLATNDHTDEAWDAYALAELAVLADALGPLEVRLVDALPRFRGYDARFRAALARARAGEVSWVDGTAVDSCHRVWFELHEDLVATLGIDRRSQP